ncbi:MAG: hypothetical protein JRK26_16575 [Deltaproteobacteria bacterium]|nr:hypothetical protein [Deltaproteobacteria bacterium]
MNCALHTPSRIQQVKRILCSFSERKIKPRFHFYLAFFVLEFVFLLISVFSHDKENIRVLFFLYLFSFLPFAYALFTGARVEMSARMIFLTAIAFRLTLLASFPVFSDDIFRYLWEGKMQLEGINPYLVPPADAITEPFRDQYWQHINHKTIATIYPPLSQVFFRLIMGVAYNLYFFKAVLIALDLAVMVFLYFIAKNRLVSLHRLLIYGWHPLVIIEISGSGHQDVIGIFFLTGCVYFWQKRNLWKSSLMLIASFLSKLFPLMLFPLLLRNKNKWPYLMLLALTIVFYLPFHGAGLEVFSGLGIYSSTWQANDSVFYVIHLLIKNQVMARIVVGVLFLMIYAYIYLKGGEFTGASLAVLGGFMILSPTLHPWYVLWIIPLLVLLPDKAWLWLTMGVAIYYYILIDYFEQGLWQEHLWIKGVIFIPFFILLADSCFKEKKFFYE